MTAVELRLTYKQAYADSPFVRILEGEDQVSSNRYVKHSNYCDISLHLSHDGATAIIISSIDNMVKGAAGQAVQNMNIALGFDETAGLEMIPPAF
jgi:N-acetyl-gamma-glutamyl-phosphate reductase